MKIVMKNKGSIKTASYNPATRTDVKKLKALRESIKANGIILPLIVDSKGNLIDGHRRLQVAYLLKIAKVPTLEVNRNLNKDAAYEIINTNQKKLSNNDMLYISVNGGMVPAKAQKDIDEMKELVGEAALKELARKYTTYRVLYIAKKIQRYCEMTDDKVFLGKTIMWMANHKMNFPVRRAMENNTNKNIIIRAIKNNKPLKVKYN